MKLVCHIGMPGTDMDAIQASFQANPQWLARHRLAYGQVLAHGSDHDTLYHACANSIHESAHAYGLHAHTETGGFRDRLSAAIRQQQDRLGDTVDTMIYSSASLTALMRHPDEIARLRDLLRDHFEEVRLLVYVRRQDDAILDLYDDWIRGGRTAQHFRTFVDTCLRPDSPCPYLFYRRELLQWVTAWGLDRIVLRRFAPEDFIDATLMADVLGVVLDTWEPDLEGFTPASPTRARLSAPALEWLRRLHPHIAPEADAATRERHALLARGIANLPSLPRPIMAAGTARHIMQHFAQANDWLQDTFCPDLDGPFFAHRADHPEQGNLGILPPDAMMELTGQLLSRL